MDSQRSSDTYKQDAPDEYKRYQYSRTGNPTREVLEKVLAKLECAKYAACFGSGLGAITTMLGLLESGDNLMCINDIYGGTNALFLQIATEFGIEITFLQNDVNSFEEAIKSNTKMIYVETPTNPTTQICDIAKVSKMAKRHNLLVTVNNTFLTQYFQRPLLLGADIVIHSLSKYMNGHSDVCMGALITNDDKINEKMNFLQEAVEVVPSPFDCHQVLRGLKTLSVRMKQHSKSGLAIAKHLAEHPKVEKVLHPGLPSHPQHELAKRQSSGHSGMLSMYIKGDLKASRRFLNAVKYFTLGPSLGSCESLIALPTPMTHYYVPLDQREQLGIADNLIRLSVGLEDTEDLIADLKQALEQI